MKLHINERSVPRHGSSDTEYIKTVFKFQKDNLEWMRNFIDSAIEAVSDAENRIDSGDFGYNDWGRTPDDDEYFAPEEKSVDDALADLYDYDRTDELYQTVFEYCRNIEDSISVLSNVVINKEDD